MKTERIIKKKNEGGKGGRRNRQAAHFNSKDRGRKIKKKVTGSPPGGGVRHVKKNQIKGW